jgi:hypothetical protein
MYLLMPWLTLRLTRVGSAEARAGASATTPPSSVRLISVLSRNLPAERQRVVSDAPQGGRQGMATQGQP